MDREPAFPTIGTTEDLPSFGMDLRDWFAGQALQGFCSIGITHDDLAAKSAYRLADAMMAARKT